MTSFGVSGPVRLAMRTLLQDHASTQAVRALDAAGIPSLLLKGPVLAQWLYDDGTARHYGDTDLLVAPDDLEPAGRVLAAAGYVRRDDRHHPHHFHAHEQLWLRPSDGAVVELHWRIPGLEAAPARQWAELSRTAEPTIVAGVQVRALGEPARALHAAVHAAQHGPGAQRPGEDLARALIRVPRAVWEEAAQLAEVLDGSAALNAGLRHTRAGAELADALGLPRRTALRYADHVQSGAALLAVLEGGSARMPALAAALAPPPGFMRAHYPLARRGRRGLAAAYAQRLLRGTRTAPATVRSAWAARRRLETRER